jgi:hypothetical protein
VEADTAAPFAGDMQAGPALGVAAIRQGMWATGSRWTKESPVTSTDIKNSVSGLGGQLGERRPGLQTLAAFLACSGAALLVYQLITVIPYFIDGPKVSVNTGPRDLYWWTSRVFEVIVLASVVAWVIYVIRERRRVGRLGIDGLLIVGMFASGFWDPIYNWLVPAWMYSTNLVTLNDWFAHAPGFVNPDAGTMQWSLVIVLIGYPLWGVGYAILVDIAMRHVKRRRPGWSGGAMIAVGLLVGTVITGVSFGLFKAMGQMTAPGYDLGLPGDELIVMAVSGGLVFGTLGIVRHYRDAEGRTIVERPQRGWVRVLASAGTCQLLVIVGWGLLTVPLSLFSEPYPTDMPQHLIESYCDLPGAQPTTKYGPCPGSPGYRMPLEGRP